MGKRPLRYIAACRSFRKRAPRAVCFLIVVWLRRKGGTARSLVLYFASLFQHWVASGAISHSKIIRDMWSWWKSLQRRGLILRHASKPWDAALDHNHYNFLKCDWCIGCFIFRKSFCGVVIGQSRQPIILGPFSKFTNHRIDYNNQSIILKKKEWNLQSWGIFYLHIVSTAHICPKCIFCFRKL